MKMIITTLMAFIVLFSAISLADANGFKFSNQYEVELIENLIKEIQSVSPDEITEYILNFNYEFKNHKDKMYSVCVIKKLVGKLCKENNFYTMNEPKIENYIKENEFSEIYDDENIWKKIKTWILLRRGLMELENKNSIKEQEEEYEKYLKRRNELLDRISKNSNSYAPILTYLSLLDGAELNYEEAPDEFIKCEDKLNSLIRDYPKSEFAKYAEIQLASNYDDKGDTQKAIEELEKIINTTDNFYSGAEDFHSSIAGDLLTLYRSIGNKEKVKYYMTKINPIVINYSEIISVCNKYLNN